MKTIGEIQENRPRFGRCSLCGHWGVFRKNHRSIREGYQCDECRASLRYRHQASVILSKYSTANSNSFAELARESDFQKLRIYEPGIIGPFRKHLKDHPDYLNSYLWEGVEPGDEHKGVRCENLEKLTFSDDSFDLIITSDIFEHVRRPYAAFAETCRVLKPGGRHIFTVPQVWPPRERTVFRVDTSEAEDTFIHPPVYHGSPTDPDGSLVYTDFGLDIVDELSTIGLETEVHKGIRYNVTFCAGKRASDASSATVQDPEQVTARHRESR